MVWWWNQPSPQSEAAPQDTTTQRERSTALQMDPIRSKTTKPKKRDQEEEAYEELRALFWNPDAKQAKNGKGEAKSVEKAPTEDYSDSIYASTMSCSNCFDQAFYCSSAVGQLNNVYRYGGLRSCSDLWAQWRFCMRTKALPEETKRAEIREFNKGKAAKYKTGPSSEDIWEIRREPIENAFTKEF